MIHWSTNEKRFKKENPKEYKIWRLTQRINYGLDGEKMHLSEVKKFWHQIRDKIDEPTKNYLEYLIWGKLPSSTRINKRFSTLS
jgi:ABC-type nitrate/sulfonate/bicarbonate transport system substrate-binding protein